MMNTKNNKYKASVNDLFNDLKQLVDDPKSSELTLLCSMHDFAIANRPMWVTAVEDYLENLLEESNIPKHQFDALQTRLRECVRYSTDEMFVATPLLWGMSLVILTSIYIAFNSQAYWPIMAFLIVVIGYSGWKISKPLGWGDSTIQSKHRLLFKIIFPTIFIFLIPFLTVFLGSIIIKEVGWYSHYRFAEGRKEFLKNSEEFPYLRYFAKTHFDIDVNLGSERETWVYTSTTLPIPNISPAAMNVYPGHCTLYMNKEKTFEEMGPSKKQDRVMWIKGIMMHEFGHCLDISRDYPSFAKNTPRIYSSHSISPTWSANVKDIDSFLDASEKESTELWREVFADIFAVGYWKLAEPTRFQELAFELRQLRANRPGDVTHETSCWIDNAVKASSPNNYNSLVEWSDLQRANFYAKCNLNTKLK
jgi:uncharacterized membrane protein